MTQVALYSKYRPKTFDEIFGQEYVIKTLKNSVSNGTFSHAYIFCGPRGTGKTSAARIFAKTINCINNKSGNPDNSCKNCLSITNSQSLDIIEIDAASHTQVDNIREVIIERANFAPVSLDYKVYIIDEVHMLSKSSFNALLKSLEEPPKHTVFILATTEINKIPSTIISRCQRFDFKRIDQKTLVKHITFIAKEEGINIATDALELVARHSEGGFRDAISLLDQLSSHKKETLTLEDVSSIIGLSDNSKIEDFLTALFQRKLDNALKIICQIDEEGQDARMFSKKLIDSLHKILLLRFARMDTLEFSKEFINIIKGTDLGLDEDQLITIIDLLVSHEQLYKNASLPYLGLEVVTIKICREQQPKQPKANNNHPQEKTGDSEQNQLKESKINADSANASKNTMNKNASWQQLLMEIKSHNNSIHAFLKVCDPEITDGQLCLYFPYKFHKERIEDTKNRQIVEAAINKIYGQNLQIKCFIKTNNKSEKIVVNDDLLEDALEIFGGEVVD